MPRIGLFFTHLTAIYGKVRGKMMINSRLTACVNGSLCLDRLSAEEVKRQQLLLLTMVMLLSPVNG